MWRDEEEKRFLKGLKAGDTVALRHYGYGKDTHTVEKVEKVTPTQIALVGHKVRWDRERGSQKGDRGGRWSTPPHIVELTAELRTEIRHARNLRLVKNAEWDGLPHEIVAAVAKVLRDHAEGVTNGQG
jgi:hypothetical protein